jgi:hypothetical protein
VPALSLSSLTIEYQWPEQFTGVWFCEHMNLLDYRPALISLASILFLGSDVSNVSVRPRKFVARKHESDEMFLEMTHKWVLGTEMQMLAISEKGAPEQRFAHQEPRFCTSNVTLCKRYTTKQKCHAYMR